MSKFLQLVFGGIFYVTSRQYHLWLIAVVLVWFPLIILAMLAGVLWDFLNDVFESLTDLFIKLRNEFDDVDLSRLFTREEFSKLKDQMEAEWHRL